MTKDIRFEAEKFLPIDNPGTDLFLQEVILCHDNYLAISDLS